MKMTPRQKEVLQTALHMTAQGSYYSPPAPQTRRVCDTLKGYGLLREVRPGDYEADQITANRINDMAPGMNGQSAAALAPPRRATRKKTAPQLQPPSATEPLVPEHVTTGVDALTLDYSCARIGGSRLIHADCFEWLSRLAENSLHAIVTDPPYGVKEYEFDQIAKRESGVGGIWRLPPSFDGSVRAPLPRFTALNPKERETLRRFFTEWGRLACHALRPGGHVFLASNSFLSQMVFTALVDGGLEFRGELVRLVRTFRGGDRPKNAEEEFPGVSSLPRGAYEPWGVFRKPMPTGMKVSDCLREWETGGLRRVANDKPFNDVILSERTPQRERAIADHPSLKPQSFLRQVIHAALPLGVGVIADTFMGSGSTVAACEAVGVSGIGAERHLSYFDLARQVVPALRDLTPAAAQNLPLDLE